MEWKQETKHTGIHHAIIEFSVVFRVTEIGRESR